MLVRCRSIPAGGDVLPGSQGTPFRHGFRLAPLPRRRGVPNQSTLREGDLIFEYRADGRSAAACAGSDSSSRQPWPFAYYWR
jgi:hypothetical protein